MAMKDPFFIVGIGASAGGIEPLTKLVSLMPIKTNAAFVVIQHLSRTHRSYLDRVLSLVTGLKVCMIAGGEQVERNTIYVVPGHSYASIENNTLRLRKRLPAELIHYGIDAFFIALAKDAGDRAIGIVLSGANEDGARGAKAISQSKGTVFAQDPDTAQFPYMPRAVIRVDSPEEIGSPEKLAKALTNLIS